MRTDRRRVIEMIRRIGLMAFVWALGSITALSAGAEDLRITAIKLSRREAVDLWLEPRGIIQAAGPYTNSVPIVLAFELNQDGATANTAEFPCRPVPGICNSVERSHLAFNRYGCLGYDDLNGEGTTGLFLALRAMTEQREFRLCGHFVPDFSTEAAAGI